LAWWAEQDRAQAIRIIRLARDTQRDPFSGIGKPESLKHVLAGCCAPTGTIGRVVSNQEHHHFA
jgi:Txe/YoeB family toxin of Txe-Axe toxin-antitoxin module